MSSLHLPSTVSRRETESPHIRRIASCVRLATLGHTSNSHFYQETVIVCLATAALGALWVSAAADFGPDGVLER